MGQIIDCERKGNMIRFYIGKVKNGEQWGDDWDDRPYDCNAEQVYDEYVDHYVDMYTSFDNLVLEPCDGYYNCPYSKEDMIKRKVPCIIVVPAKIAEGTWNDDDFKYWVGADGVGKVYFGDDEESVLKFAHLYPMAIGEVNNK